MHVAGKRFLIFAAAICLLLSLISAHAALIGVACFAGFYAWYFLGDEPPSAPVVAGPPQTISLLAEHDEPPPVFHHPPPAEFIAEPQSRFAGLELGPSIPKWTKPSATIAERVALVIAKQITQLKTLFASKLGDVLLTDEQARLAKTASSAINRHGSMIEDTILKGLEACPRYRAWKARTLGTDEASDEDGGHRKMDVDLVVFDTQTHRVTGYEVKRDTANVQDVERKLTVAKSLLVREAETEGFIAISADVAIISYYGGLHSKHFPVITRENLDEHFGTPLRAEVEAATAKYRAELQSILLGSSHNERRAA